MNFGGLIDLTPFGSLLRGIGLVYWAMALGAAGIALYIPKRWIVKLPLALAVIAAFVYPAALRVQEAKRFQEARQARLDAAIALFDERCKTSGERIHRTVDNVEGVVWMKWRDKGLNRDEQFKLDDPYGHDCGGEDCLIRLLKVTRNVEKNPVDVAKHRGVYRYVETIDPHDGRWYRYYGAMRLSSSWTADDVAKHKRETGQDPPSISYRVSVDREPIDRPTARYGISWDDISTQEDRERWVAGGSLKVIDLRSNEVIGERIGYMVDRGQGSKAGFAAPWLLAQQYACPTFSTVGASDPRRMRSDENRQFVTNVLKPAKGA